LIYLMMADHSFREVSAATNARVVESCVVCSDAAGVTVASFNAPSVSAFGVHSTLRDPALAGLSGIGIRRDRELAEAPLASARTFSTDSLWGPRPVNGVTHRR
jgi:hypothetical protein